MTCFLAVFPTFFDVLADDVESLQPTCAQQIFANALIADAAAVNEESPEVEIQAWIYKNFQDKAVIKKVLACPEIAALDDEETMFVPPVEYLFPQGRKLVINYETQPKILQQRLLLSDKRDLPWMGEDCVYPVLYGYLVCKSGALDTYIGEDKNNTISLRYIEDNIRNFYPQNYNDGTMPVTATPRCTTRSAFAHNDDIVNLAATETVGLDSYGDENGDGEKDTNDYYIAGDVNLQWITWAEVAIDVAITVLTVGGGTAVMGAAKGTRAIKVEKNLIKVMGEALKLDKVKEFHNIANSIKNQEKVLKSLKELKAADNAAELNRLARIKDLETNIGKLKTSSKELEKLDDVKKYKGYINELDKIKDLTQTMKAWKIPQRGNVIARAWRTVKGVTKLMRGGKTISRAEKVARAGMKSGKIRNWLFTSSLKNVGRLAKMERQAGLLYGALKFAGDMYDWTETSTGEFTSNIEFKPFGLLSADDIKGQENVVNHGMWLMWAGDSISAEDDDAAFLQAMDFANKFHQDMQEVQDKEIENGRGASTLCDVDIFVVRPIIRNPDSDNAQLYYLIMNDIPWTVRAGGQ